MWGDLSTIKISSVIIFQTKPKNLSIVLAPICGAFWHSTQYYQGKKKNSSSIEPCDTNNQIIEEVSHRPITQFLPASSTIQQNSGGKKRKSC